MRSINSTDLSSCCYLPFLGTGILSTTVVDGRRRASSTGINCPVLASLPICLVAFFAICSPLGAALLPYLDYSRVRLVFANLNTNTRRFQD